MNARPALLILLLLVACGAPAPQQPRTGPRAARMPEPSEQMVRQAGEAFEVVATSFLDWYYESHPVRATELGVHEYDEAMPELDRTAIQRRIEALLDWERRLRRVPFDVLEGDPRFDYAVLEYAIRGELLELEEIRRWAADPRMYTAPIASGIPALLERDFAPLDQRLRAARARMLAAPAALEAARENLTAPPRLWTELGIAEARGLIQYLEEGIPALPEMEAGTDATGAQRFEEARVALVEALDEHAAWLEEELLPRSTGEFRLGRYLFLRKLLYEEHVDLSIEVLDRLNQEAIAEYRAQVALVAAEIDSSRTPGAIMDSLARLHPTPEELLPTAREMMESARTWVLESDVVTVPTNERPTVREAPAYARGGFAAMDAPGPFEEGGADAFFMITNVLPSWTDEEEAEHLTYFNYPALLGITLHETFPGHFVQLAVARQVDRPIRKVFSARSFVEGWAHYAEQMALDEGFRADDPAVRLGQLRRALQRHARWHAGLHLHAFGAGIDEVVEQFMEIAYFEEFPARREVIRATYDPTYLYYALGRMQILDLRKDYQAFLEEQDREFSLREFHNRILELALPLTLAREVLIPTRRERPRQIYRR